MLTRLVEICSSYLKGFVTTKNALNILLVAHSHNALQLEQFCINFIVSHEGEIVNSRNFRNFKRRAQEGLLKVIEQSLNQEKEESYVQMCINNFKQVRTERNPMNEVEDCEDLNELNSKEIDLDSIFDTTQYIFLEEHYRAETYNMNRMAILCEGTIPLTKTNAKK
jgi:ABC-type multidrug transport system ATPase subunit